ncbi:MAG: hypothetical protein EA376_14345 [Phycisphaeraceae bacterium]|nr:MAG: hypothetical protein EA376_14345 [Phycisphaeraceae bacterium]
MSKGPAPRRDKQAGKAIERILGDRGQIIYPDGGAKPLKVRVRPRRGRPPEGGHGSHMNGRHKMG